MAALQARSEFLSVVDAALLRTDEPTNLAMISAVLMLDQPVDLARIRAVATSRLLPFVRFRQRVREPRLGIGLPRWELDPRFDIDAHLHRIALPAPGDDAALQELTGDLMSTPLDRTKPLWQVHLVENHGGGSALIVRMHHCIADGLALVRLLLSTTDTQRDAPPPNLRADEAGASQHGWLRLPEPISLAADLAKQAGHTAEKLIGGGLEALRNPAFLVGAAALAAEAAKSLGRTLLMEPDRATILKGSCGVRKRAVWTRRIPLAGVKAIGKLMDGTVNDVLLTAAAGALHRYLEDHAQETDGVEIRAMVPVSIRMPGDADKLDNRFGMVALPLPIGIGDPRTRLAELKRRMDAIKDTPEPYVAFGLMGMMGLAPQQIQRVASSFLCAKTSAVMTNVPGPRQPLYLAGAEIRDLMIWAPNPAPIGLGISILTYAGHVSLGVAADAGLIPDPERIVTGFRDELESMGKWLAEEPATAAPAADTAPDLRGRQPS